MIFSFFDVGHSQTTSPNLCQPASLRFPHHQHPSSKKRQGSGAAPGQPAAPAKQPTTLKSSSDPWSPSHHRAGWLAAPCLVLSPPRRHANNLLWGRGPRRPGRRETPRYDRSRGASAEKGGFGGFWVLCRYFVYLTRDTIQCSKTMVTRNERNPGTLCRSHMISPPDHNATTPSLPNAEYHASKMHTYNQMPRIRIPLCLPASSKPLPPAKMQPSIQPNQP